MKRCVFSGNHGGFESQKKKTDVHDVSSLVSLIIYRLSTKMYRANMDGKTKL
jgi:hypothetical protein